MANYWHNQAKMLVLAGSTGEIDLINTAIQIMAWQTLTGDDPDNDFVADLTGGSCVEVTSTGYTGGFGGAGRLDLASKAYSVDETNDRAEFDCADPLWSSISQAASETWVGFSIIREDTSDSDSEVIVTIDTATNLPITPNGSNIQFTVHDDGLLNFT